MSCIDYVYGACRELFASYPRAIRAEDDCEGNLRSMILLLQDDSSVEFFVLSRDRWNGSSSYSIGRWPDEDAASIEACRSSADLDVIMKVVTQGVPIPRHGSLFGWRTEGIVTALIVVYAERESQYLTPSFAVMPLVGVPKPQWPPFTEEVIFGRWFWEHYWTGDVISLSRLVAATSDAIFWVDTVATMGSGCCAVARNIESQDGYTLQRGLYVYHRALQQGESVPQLSRLLADLDKVDMAPWFEVLECYE
jgi:hypothetical protein